VASLALLIRSGGISLEHLAEFRIKIEGSIVELATQRATPEDLQEDGFSHGSFGFLVLPPRNCKGW